MTTKTGRGRPTHSPLKKAVSECVKNRESLDAVEKEFQAMVGLGNDKDLNEDLNEVVDSRKALAEEKDELTKKIRAFSAKNDHQNKIKYENRRKELDLDLRKMPPLGFTFEQWKDEDVESAEMDRGRPSLEIEVKLVRAERALRESRAIAVKLLQKEGKNPEDLDSMIKIEMSKEIKPGRPKSDELGKLDKKLSDTQKKIDFIESGEAEKERKEKASYSKTGALKGRTPTPLDELLLDCKSELESIQNRIELLESKLDDNGKLNRQLKVLRDQKRALKKKLSQDLSLTGKKLLSNPEMKVILAHENLLMDKIKSADGSLVTKRPLVKTGENKTADKIAQSKKSELNKKDAEDKDLSEKLSEEDSILERLAKATQERRVVNG